VQQVLLKNLLFFITLPICDGYSSDHISIYLPTNFIDTDNFFLFYTFKQKTIKITGFN